MVDPLDPPPATQTEGDAPTEGLAGEFLAAGQLLGDRYQVRRMLGAGGMGEVWQAFDLKLQVEVALKALRADIFADDKRIEGLRREVRAAREVVSPNVCRIFDLEEVDGHELVSMEYVDGQTLLEVLKERGPLELKEAQDIASQLLAGLEAIHSAGLVHRDIKPENIMLTRTGRVVVMDFGIARGQEEGAGTVSGTPAYMSPEQGRGGAVDTRSDLYAAGVVLAEMVSPEGVRDRDSRENVWQGVRHDPPRIADTPWAPVLSRAVAHDSARRYDSAQTLTRALEEITLRVEGAEDLNPYPGLASFTEEDAEYFFGREAEVEQMWRRLEGPARLLALVGPSGAGKSSFLRAGVIPNAGAAWGIVRCTPGDTALASLRRTVIPQLAGDVEALEQLAAGDEDATVAAFARWRRRHDRTLLIVDQFEELFTQNTDDDQGRVASVLSRLVLEADVHVLLGMRDDFLYRCHKHDELSPITSGLTLLGPPVGAALRRAVVQPAMQCGYRFEDEDLVDEMLAEVEGERGALPLLAFAMARLWERRDRQEGLLTREAYGQVGGVEGALAQHAEQTLEEIGTHRLPIVRELFRNLVTAEHTRAVRGWDELLSVFDDREAAQEVLRALIDARLLTSYEVEDENGHSHRLVEIVHESLLASWPRLVRWQTQDADAAQLRDQLRQAAKTWEEHDRSDDMLWTGSAYREFAVWREGYAGGLSETEEAFAAAMTALAERRRRRRRLAAVSALILVSVVAGVFAALWRRSVLETLRAEATQLITKGRMAMEDSLNPDPTASVANALASLELTDSEEARELAVQALWRRPPRFLIQAAGGWGLDFGPDGRQLAVGFNGNVIGIWRPEGGRPVVLRPESPAESFVPWVRFADEPGLLFSATGPPVGGAHMWSIPENRLLRSFECGGMLTYGHLHEDGRRFITWTASDDRSRMRLTAWPLPEGDPIELGELPFAVRPAIDPSGTWLAYPAGQELKLLPLENLGGRSAVAFAPHEHSISSVGFDQHGTRVATGDLSGEIRVWSITQSPAPLLRRFRSCTDNKGLVFSLDGPLLAVLCTDRVWLHDLGRPAEAMPLELAAEGTAMDASFDPQGRWLAVSALDGIAMYQLDRRYPSVMSGHAGGSMFVAFAPDGSWLASASWDGTVRLWPVPGSTELHESRVLVAAESQAKFHSLAVTPDGESLVVGTNRGEVWLYPLYGGDPRLVGRTKDIVQAIAISPDGRTVATGAGFNIPEERVIRLWDLRSGSQQVLDPPGERDVTGLEFTRDGRLLAASGGTLRRWNLEDGSSEVLVEEGVGKFDLSADREMVLFRSGTAFSFGTVGLVNLAEGTVQVLPGHDGGVRSVALDPTGSIAVSATGGGVVRVSRINDDASHLLSADRGSDPWGLAVSPDGRWIAAGASDGAVHIWPMPDLDKPPLQTLPRDELIAKLKTLTNLRVVRDEESSTGWTTKLDPFPGWETVPSW